MEFGFNDQQEELKRSAREVLGDKVTSQSIRKAMKSKTGTDDTLWATVSDLGWNGVAIAEQDGGLGLGLMELAILSEELGYAAAPIPFTSTVSLAAQVVDQLDDGEARAGFLKSVAAGEKRAALALGLKDGRFDAAGVAVKAAQVDGGWKFTGVAAGVPEAHLADDLVVVARTARSRNPEEGVSVFIVPRDALKSKPKPQATLDQTRRMCDVRLSGVVVPAAAMVGAEGQAWQGIRRGLDRAAVLVAAEGVGVAARALEMAVEYAKEREQFGKKIGSFQAISHKCANMLLALESARSNVYYAAWALDEGTPDAPLAAATAKAAAADAARICVTDGIQVHGGIGFTYEHDMHLYYRRAKWCELYLGDATHWRARIASFLAAAS